MAAQSTSDSRLEAGLQASVREISNLELHFAQHPIHPVVATKLICPYERILMLLQPYADHSDAVWNNRPQTHMSIISKQ